MKTSKLPPVLYPLVSLAVLLIIWQALADGLHIPEYILPAPTVVGRGLLTGLNDGSLWPNIWETLKEILLGYVISCVLAVALGAALAESAVFERFVYPLLSGLQATPKVALAPLLLVWLGFGLAPKIVLVVLVCFFPLFVNTLNGLRRANVDLLDTCRAFSATRLFLFLHVKLPSAASEILGGMQISFALALIGAIVAEFLSSERGLGYLIQSASVNMNGPAMFVGVILLAAIGMAGSALVRWIQRRVVFWEGGRP